MNITEILQSWKEDTRLDDVQLDSESLKIPSLHHKYIEELTLARSRVKGLKIDLRKLRSRLFSYYSGESTSNDLEILGREQFRGRILKSEIKDRLDMDSEVITLESRIEASSEKVDLLTDIMKSIHSRGFQINTAVNHRKLMVGA